MLENITNIIPLSLTSQTLLLATTVGVVTYFAMRKKYKLPPGPWRPPLIGIMLDMNKKPLYKLLMDWKKQYGSVLTVYLGPVRCIILNDVVAVNEALVKKDADFAGRFHSHSISLLSRGYKDIAMSDYSPAWKHMRKIALQGLRQFLYGSKLENELFTSAMKMMKCLREKQGQRVDVNKYISLTIFDVFQSVCFNKCFDFDDEQFLELIHIFETVNTDFGNGFLEDIFPPLRMYPTARFKRVVAMFEKFIGFIEGEFETHKKNFSEDNMNDITDFLIHAKHQAVLEDPEVETLITDVHLSQIVSDIFSAGTDTTRQTISWTLLLLAAYPDIQKKAQAEIDAVIDVNQAPTIKDRVRLPYTEAVLHESMRICPVAPLGIPHSTRCDTTLGEYEIPKDTMVFINHYALHFDPDHWKDPEVFRPERMLDEDGNLAPKTMSWLPFSAGRRNCLGETVARPEMHLLLTILLRNFTFKSPEGESVDLTPIGSLTFLPPKADLIVVERE